MQAEAPATSGNPSENPFTDYGEAAEQSITEVNNEASASADAPNVYSADGGVQQFSSQAPDWDNKDGENAYHSAVNFPLAPEPVSSLAKVGISWARLP